MIRSGNIPAALRERPQWIMWDQLERDGKPTKIPFRPDGTPAKSNDPATWTTFAEVTAAFDPDKFTGIGYVFAENDPFVGVDLDGCRDPETGIVSEWAREVILKLDTYAEVSPSATGVKLFGVGVSPFDTGRKIGVPDAPRVCDKSPAVEVYDHGRYFAVTGLQLKGPAEPRACPGGLAWLKDRFWKSEPARPSLPLDFHGDAACVERARKYVSKIPGAVSGQGGHNATFHAACVLVLGFDLSESDATLLLAEWNATCTPPWPEKEIARKVREAAKQPSPRGYLRNVAPANWSKISVPIYKLPPRVVKTTTVASASRGFVDLLAKGPIPLAKTTIPDLDHAVGGGFGFGEMVMFGGRPGHGKSAIALQFLHHWTELTAGSPAVIVSEEMSALMLGRRTVQHISSLREDEWVYRVDDLRRDVDDYEKKHADCFIVENCGTTLAAAEAIERHVKEDGARYAVIDYAQLLKAEGKSRYEQVTNTSIILRQLATRTNVVLVVLCQLNRGIEHRSGGFMPVMSDIKDSGQLEQDADVIVLSCWPYRLDQQESPDRYQFFVLKNRNRGIMKANVECQFIAARQIFREMPPEEFRRTGIGFEIPD